MVDRLTQRSIQLGRFPQSGRKVPELNVANVREVIEAPYRIIFLVKEHQIEILAVLHGAMSFPSGLE